MQFKGWWVYPFAGPPLCRWVTFEVYQTTCLTNQNASSSEWDCIKTPSKTKILSKGIKIKIKTNFKETSQAPHPTLPPSSSTVLLCLLCFGGKTSWWRHTQFVLNAERWTQFKGQSKTKENFYQGSHLPKPEFSNLKSNLGEVRHH